MGVQVFLSDSAFRQIEDYVRALDETEQKVAKDRAKQEIEAQAGLMPADTYSPFAISFTEETNLVGGDAYGSTSALPLTANAGFAGSPYAESDTKSFFDDGASRFEGAPSLYGSEAYAPQSNMFRGGEKDHFALAEKGELDAPKMPAQTVEVVRVTAARKWWVAMTWAATFWIPGFMLGGLGRLKRPDVRMAWREKLLIKYVLACASIGARGLLDRA
jgi:chitin synthase